MESIGMIRQSVGHGIACPKTFKNYIQCLICSALQWKVASPRGTSQSPENRRSLRTVSSLVQINTIQLNFASQGSVDGIAQRTSAGGVETI